MNSHLELVRACQRGAAGAAIPCSDQLYSHLNDRLAEIGEAKAFAEFAYLQAVAARTWGPHKTSHFAAVLRRSRARSKQPRKTAWEKASDALSRLPEAWQPAFQAHIERSRRGKRVVGGTLWSADHTTSVIAALARWYEFCDEISLGYVPSGTSFLRYAARLTTAAPDGLGLAAGTASDYLSRILSGVSLVDPDFISESCSLVMLDLKAQSEQEAPRTKSGAQLVGAMRIFELGFELMEQARQREIRGVEAATLFRNGLLLSIAVALPQRARALSCLAFDQSLWLMPEDRLRFLIPANKLKLPEAEKSTSPLELTFRSIRLAEALEEYRVSFRPIFDDSAWVFPSSKAQGAGIGERHLGRIVGNITEEALGVRVSVHRIRDNVATEASEIHSAGATAASLLLGHRDLRTTQRHYDHSTGLAVATEFATHLDSLRSSNILLDV